MSVRSHPLAWALVAGLLVGAPHLAGGLWALPFIGLPLLFAVLEAIDAPRRALLAGFVAGLAATTVMFYWITYTMVVYGGLPMPVSALAFAGYAVIFGTRFPVLAGVAWWLRRRGGAAPALAGPLATLGADMFQVALFPMYVGSSEMGNLYFMQIADVIGATGLTFVVALVGALGWQALLQRRLVSTPAGLLVAVLAVVYGYGVVRLGQIEALEAREKPVRVALVQPCTPLRWERGDPDLPRRVVTTCARLTMEASRAAGGPLDLVVWPEGGTPFSFSPSDRPQDRLLRETVLLLANNLHVNMVFYDLLFEGARPFNNVWLLGRNGEVRGSYQKVKLLAFGEYIPGADVFPFLQGIGGVVQHRRGTSLHTLQADFGVLGPQICYEILFSGATRELARLGARYIINVTNDAWFGPTTASRTHLVVAYPRAIEVRRPLVRCTNSGITTVIAASGRFQTPLTETFVPTFQVAEIRSPDVMTFYALHGDVFSWMWVAVAALYGLRPWWGRRRTTGG